MCVSLKRGVTASWNRVTLKSLWWQEITTWTQISLGCRNTQGKYRSQMRGSNNQKEESSIYFVSANRSHFWSTVRSFGIRLSIKCSLGKGGDLRSSTRITRKCYLSKKKVKRNMTIVMKLNIGIRVLAMMSLGVWYLLTWSVDYIFLSFILRTVCYWRCTYSWYSELCTGH